ncbi:phage integrase SAM-like domain-containing protein [Kaistella sp.]|uniref:site-specific integrase n=1 Tax=Kaistella sp. TaxID=2782235 RepID=UPI00359F562E
MVVKYHTQFLLDKEKDNTTAKIRFRIKWENNIVAFNLGHRVEIDKWSTETQRCKTNTTHGNKKISASIINKKISEYESACERVFRKFELDKIVPDSKSFRNAFNLIIGKVEKQVIVEIKSFFELFDQFTKDESRLNQWTISTEAKLRSIKKHLLNFNPQITFEDFTESGLLDYQLYLQKKLKFKNSTILKNFSFLKWFLRWALRKGFHKNNSFELFNPKLKLVRKKIIFLTQDELKDLKQCSIPAEKQYLERVRDIFLFQCYTGLRYSDVENLKKTDIKENFIEITTVKTSDNLTIELNNHSKAIILKYEDEIYKYNKAFPVITNQKMNEYLKELAEIAEIDEPIRETYYKGNERIDEVTPKHALLSSHAGRRTFICNALALGIPPQVVMKWTGHSDYKAMKPYIDIADQTKINAMEKFNLI